MIYVYRKPDGSHIDVWMSMEDKENRQKADGSITLEDGTTAVRDIVAEHGGFRHVPEAEIKSDSLGCAPAQADAFEKQSVEMGCPIQIDRRTGQALFSGRKHRNRYMKAMNSNQGTKMYDRDGGYSDPQ